MTNFVYLTKERIIELENELKELKTEGRKNMAERIATARSYGDLSENAEYDAAKEEQGLLELNISKKEALLARAKVVDTTSFAKDKVHILAKVQVKNLNNQKVYDYEMVSPEEANLQEGKIAVTSPVGQALMGSSMGETVAAKVPAGLIKFEILKIE